MVVTLFRLTVPPASVVTEVSGVVAPTFAAKLVAPLLFTTSACAPSTAPVKLTGPLPAVMLASPASVLVAFRLTPALLVWYRPLSVAFSP